MQHYKTPSLNNIVWKTKSILIDVLKSTGSLTDDHQYTDKINDWCLQMMLSFHLEALLFFYQSGLASSIFTHCAPNEAHTQVSLTHVPVFSNLAPTFHHLHGARGSVGD